MKLVFTKLETPATEIKVAFDGVNYKSYNVDEIKSTGYIQFTEDECPDLTKVKIQGKFSTLGSVEVNKAIELERGEVGESGISYTFEKDVFEEIHYYCFALDNDNNGEIDEDDDDLMNQGHFWLKGEISKNAEPFWAKYEALPNSVDGLESVWSNNPNLKVWIINENTIGGTYNPDVPALDAGRRWIRYPEGDLIEKVKVGTETVTEVITEIQDEPTITENGQTVADEGKAFKSVKIENAITMMYFWGTGNGCVTLPTLDVQPGQVCWYSEDNGIACFRTVESVEDDTLYLNYGTTLIRNPDKDVIILSK